MELNVQELSTKEVVIVILGQKNLYCLNEAGTKMKFMKRFEFSPLCFTSFILGDCHECPAFICILLFKIFISITTVVQFLFFSPKQVVYSVTFLYVYLSQREIFSYMLFIF